MGNIGKLCAGCVHIIKGAEVDSCAVSNCSQYTRIHKRYPDPTSYRLFNYHVKQLLDSDAFRLSKEQIDQVWAVFAAGAKKHGDRDGHRFEEHVKHMEDHRDDPLTTDPETGLDNYAHAICRAILAIIELAKEWNDEHGGN